MTSAQYPNFVFAEIHDHYGPEDRGTVYEDVLAEALMKNGFGEITGAGSQLGPDGEIKFIGLDLNLINLEEALDFVKTFLEGKGAPVGSRFLIGSGSNQSEIPFGLYQELSIYIDAKDEDHLYHRLETECNLEEFNELMTVAVEDSGAGEPRGSWGSSTKLALYFFSKDIGKLEEALFPILKKYPIFSGATILKKTASDKIEESKLSF